MLNQQSSIKRLFILQQVCKKEKSNLSPGEYPHMTCEIHGRPCCMGNEAICRIVSRDECDFFRGRFHENLTLCSQVTDGKGVLEKESGKHKRMEKKASLLKSILSEFLQN